MEIHEELERLHPNTKVYGPYVSKADGRSRVVFRETRSDGSVIRGGKSFSMSLARAKMTVKEGRILSQQEEVDHRDEDRTNDDIDNLQILDKIKHQYKSAGEAFVRTNNNEMVSCPNCGTDFFCDRTRFNVAAEKGKTPCCSRSCSSKLYGANQHTR